MYTFVQDCNLTESPAPFETIILPDPTGDENVPASNIFLTNHISSTMQVDLNQPVGDLNLSPMINQTDQAISATLTSPAGTVVQLFNGESGGGVGFGTRCKLEDTNLLFDPLANFILDDDSAFQFGDGGGTAPFTGTAVHPAEALSAFHGENPDGTWTLDIYAPNPSGYLQCWSVQFEDGVSPPIELNKTVSTDPNTCGTVGEMTFTGPTPVTYCYEVTNNSGYTLTTHDLVDSELGSILSNFSFDLTPGASVWLTQTATITETTINLATWTAYSAEPNVLTGTDTSSATVFIQAPYILHLPTVLKGTMP
jgi:hypothetical protein